MESNWLQRFAPSPHRKQKSLERHFMLSNMDNFLPNDHPRGWQSVPYLKMYVMNNKSTVCICKLLLVTHIIGLPLTLLQQRALSCVGLLATSGRKEDDACSLWLVDMTGAYRVRAHSVGLGAKIINERLRKMDFTTLTVDEGALRLLETLVEEPEENEDSKDKEAATWKLPENALVEVAVVSPGKQKMNRMRVDDLSSLVK